jgi:cytochrome c-type biogenesis protein CcmH/NrfG
VELQPENARALRLLGESLVAQKKYAEAVLVLRQAVDAVPADVRLRLELARALMQANHPESAQRQLEQALRLDPGNERIRQELEKPTKVKKGEEP